MAGVPQLEVPEASPSAPGLVAEPTARPEAFSGDAVGSGLSKIGEALHGVGMEAYHAAVKSDAQEKETQFQAGALKIRDSYRTKFNGDAIAAHDATTVALEELRVKLRGTIATKSGQSLYNDNSLRRAQIVQESVDSHFETQNRQYQEITYKSAQEMDTRTVAKLAADAEYNPKSVKETLNEISLRAAQRGLDQGLKGAALADFQDGQMKVATHALFTELLNTKGSRDPELVKSELEKYSKLNWIDPSIYNHAIGALNGASARMWAVQTFAALPRVSHSIDPAITDADKDYKKHVLEPKGYIPADAVQEALSKIDKTDPKYKEKYDGLLHLVREAGQQYVQQGAQMHGDLVKLGAGADGKFKIPIGSMQWEEYKSLYPTDADKMAGIEKSYLYKIGRQQKTNDNDRARNAYASISQYLGGMPLTDVRDISREQIKQMAQDRFTASGGTGLMPEVDMNRTLEKFQKIKDGKEDPTEKKFNTVAYKVLNETYKGNVSKVKAASNKAWHFLDDLHRDPATANLDIGELQAKLEKEAKKPDFFDFSNRAIENYEPKPRASRIPVLSDKADLKKLQPGDKYRKPGDPPGFTRTKKAGE